MRTGGLSAARCSVRMLQAAEMLNQNPRAEGEMWGARGGG